jgi:hypothetical protein
LICKHCILLFLIVSIGHRYELVEFLLVMFDAYSA